MLLLIFFDRIDRDLCGDVVGEVKLACADTAERYTFQIILHSFIQAGEVTAFEQLAVLVREPAVYDRTHGVDHIFARQVISGCNLRLSCRLLVTLHLHKLITGVTELYARVGVDGVVDAAVTGIEAAEHLRVGGVDDGVAFQRGDVTLPEIDTLLHRFQVGDIGDAFARSFFLQILILHTQEFLGDRRGHTDIEQ